MLPGHRLQVGPHLVSLRPAGEVDLPFLRAVYESTREEELERVPWPAEQKRLFLEHQFLAQDHAYRNNYPGADFSILVVDGTDAGRFYLHRRPAEIRVMDIALLPAYRSRGIGGAVLRRLFTEGDESGRTVSIHVEVFNPALRLYERLGFRRAGGNEVYLLMERKPGTLA